MYSEVKTLIKNYNLKRKLPKGEGSPLIEIAKSSVKAVLIIDCMIPEYNKDSGSRRLSELMKLLVKKEIEVFLLADLKEYKYNSDYIKTYKALGINIYEPYLDEQNQLIDKKRFIKEIVPHLQYVWLHRPDIFQKFYSIIIEANENCKCIFDMVDFHYLRLIREFELNNDKNLKKEADAILKIELDNCKKADTIIAISQKDKKELLSFFTEEQKIEVISNVHQHIEKSNDFIQFKEREHLLFIGSFKHLPNVDAVKFLKNEIMPIVWKKNPEIKVEVIGSYPSEDIKNLGSENFIINGFVDDVSIYFKKAKLLIAPLRFGAGIKGKIGQSLEYSLPLITTNVGGEGFNFSQYESNMIANNPKEFASKILELYSNESLWNSISDHSKHVLNPFSKETAGKTLLKVLEL